jgi:organic radical activating enzyme
MKTYAITEIFHSLQGEGLRAGTANVFVRFAGCNLDCKKATHGFDCDTDFGLRRRMTAAELLTEVDSFCPCPNVIFTGGEPALQLDADLVDLFKRNGFYLAVETNGTLPLPEGIDWICCSPKRDFRVVLSHANEAKYVLADGEHFRGVIDADAILISPVFNGPELDKAALAWCISLVMKEPQLRLSVQQHKQWGVR